MNTNEGMEPLYWPCDPTNLEAEKAFMKLFGGLTFLNWKTAQIPDPYDLEKWDPILEAAWPDAIATYGLKTNPDGSPVVKPSYAQPIAGMVTLLDGIAHIDRIKGARIYGTPASGIDELFRDTYGKLAAHADEQGRIKSSDEEAMKLQKSARGQIAGFDGEVELARLLQKDQILDRCVSFWSVKRADGRTGNAATYSNGKPIGSDIDCVLLCGNHVILIDVKNYQHGFQYHTLVRNMAMFSENPKTHTVTNVYRFSSNLAFAQRNFSQYFNAIGACTVESYVVIVPDRRGYPTLDEDIRFPGNIPIMTYDGFKKMLEEKLSQDNTYTLKPNTTCEEEALAALVNGNELEARTVVPLPEISQQVRDLCGYRDDDDEHPKKKMADNNIIYTLPRLKDGCELPVFRDAKKHTGSLSFRGVSGAWFAGAARSGCTPCVRTIVAALADSGEVDLTVIDGYPNSAITLRAYACPAYDYYAVRQEAVDGEAGGKTSKAIANLDELESVLSGVDRDAGRRQRKLQALGAHGFWDAPDHGGLRLRFLVINDAMGLLTRECADPDDERLRKNILTDLRHILDKGAAAGVCTIFMTSVGKNQGTNVLLPDLVTRTQIRACFYIDSTVPGQSAVPAALLGEGNDGNVHFGATPKEGRAYLYTGDGPAVPVTFLHAKKSKGKKNES